KKSAILIAQKICLLVSEMPCSVTDNLSCSFGVTVFNKESDTEDIFIDRTDRAMYEAKKLGKNRVEFLMDESA
ncbi:MAG TPA: GGDEF domain-containing protein, partial [Sulfurimonas sp.]|nr:GGDEF domain-containing protein [Sulfurimonas sp.]